MDATGLNLFVPGCLHYRSDPPLYPALHQSRITTRRRGTTHSVIAAGELGARRGMKSSLWEEWGRDSSGNGVATPGGFVLFDNERPLTIYLHAIILTGFFFSFFRLVRHERSP